MKKSMTFRPFRLLVLLAGCAGYAAAAPYPPQGRETSWVQPDGTNLQLRVIGDEYYARTENADGYTLIHSDNDKAYHYASLDAAGTGLVALETLANAPAPAGLAKHIDLPKKTIREIAAARHLKFDGNRLGRWNKRVQAYQKLRGFDNGPVLPKADAAKANINAAPVIGNKRGLTILVQFPNDPQTAGTDPVTFPTNREKIVRFCNGVGYKEDGNTGSVRDFFYDQSLGKLTYTQTVTTVVTLPKPRSYYNYSDYPANTNLQASDVAAREIINDAVAILKTQDFDFSSLTTDSSNNAIATNVFFAGQDSGVFAQGLWPHQYFITPLSVGTPSAPMFLSAYEITNIPNASPVIGTFCHENGHLLLDYPDIYDVVGEGVGEHCLMGSGNYLNDGKTPSPINGYFKELVGWGNVTELATGDFKTVTLPTTGNVAYRIANPSASTEFFMVENRGDGDKWANYSDDKGIAIWHIDETINGNLSGAAHYGVALEQADGNMDLENGRNRGDNRDLFDLGSPKFNDTSKPNARWWSGAASAVKVEVLGAAANKVQVTFGAVPANTIIVGSPNGGEVIYPDSKYEIKWQANIAGNVKIDLLKNGEFNSVITDSDANDGSFDWPVPKSLAGGNNYTIRISSITNPIPVDDVSNANFTISEASFPENNVLPYGWFKPSGSNTMWKVTNKTSYEGSHSLYSGPLGDGKKAGIAYRSNFKAGILSFYIKVSSEQSFDIARFYIDGEPQVFKALGGRGGLSGDIGWTYASFPISAGNHTFQWTYEKDDSYAGLRDAVWLDGVSLPESTQEIVVSNSEGEKLVDGISKVSFPDRTMGTSSEAVILTIKNNGKADLSGLKLTVTGANKADFKAGSLGKTALAKGQSTTFKLFFSPTEIGLRSANVQIHSNDTDEGNFTIALEGTGLGLPKITVNQPTDTKIEDDGKAISFGIANVGTTGATKTFTIRNIGTAELKGLKISKTGTEKSDFSVGAPGTKSLAPGASTTFKVTFSPTFRDKRSAVVHIDSNDKASGTFDINIYGKGAPQALASAGSFAPGGLAEAVLGGLPSTSHSVESVEIVGGNKYLTLTVIKQSGGAAGTVEVSPNLLDWYSGNRHTTVVTDNATTLKVRDNTPVKPETKRYIRLK